MLKKYYFVLAEPNTFVYIYGPGQEGLCMRRIYVDSRHPVLGFSVALVFKAMLDLS